MLMEIKFLAALYARETNAKFFEERNDYINKIIT